MHELRLRDHWVTKMISQESIAQKLVTVAVKESGREMTSRLERAIDMAAAGVAVKRHPKLRDAYCVQSSDGTEWYTVTTQSCTCPDKSDWCKHGLYLTVLDLYGRLLADRLGVRWSKDIATVDELQEQYLQLLRECETYQPPAPGMLASFGIESVREDMQMGWRDRQRIGYRASHPAFLIKPPTPWCAKILGLCPEYEFRREFIRGHKDYRGADKKFKRGVWIYWELPDGLYEAQEIEPGYPMPVGIRFFFRVENQAVTRISRKEVLACLRGSPVPSSGKCQP